MKTTGLAHRTITTSTLFHRPLTQMTRALVDLTGGFASIVGVRFITWPNSATSLLVVIRIVTRRQNIVLSLISLNSGTKMNDWWDNGNNQIAFCRGGKGFIAMNNEGTDMNQTLQVFLLFNV